MARCSVCHSLPSKTLSCFSSLHPSHVSITQPSFHCYEKANLALVLAENLMRPQKHIMQLNSGPSIAFLSISFSFLPNIIQISVLASTSLSGCLADGPVKHLFRKTVDRAVGTGARAKLARAAADNAIWMPVTTCLLFAALKLAQGQPEEIASGLQVRPLLLSLFFLLQPSCFSRLVGLIRILPVQLHPSQMPSHSAGPCVAKVGGCAVI